METKIKYYGDKTTDFHDFHDKEVPKVGPSYPCLAVISLDSILRNDENSSTIILILFVLSAPPLPVTFCLNLNKVLLPGKLSESPTSVKAGLSR